MNSAKAFPSGSGLKPRELFHLGVTLTCSCALDSQQVKRCCSTLEHLSDSAGHQVNLCSPDLALSILIESFHLPQLVFGTPLCLQP